MKPGHDPEHSVQKALDEALATWPPGPVTVACSGGVDSIALLHALAHHPLAKPRALRALHIDHGLHAHSAQWCERVREAASAWAVPFHAERVVVAVGAAEGLEAAARRARYLALLCHQRPHEITVTAHHADDQAETFLLRCMRGSGADGLSSMRALRPWAQGWLARPWLSVPRSAIVEYAQQQGLEWCEDPANRDERHDRNYLRHQILPRLQARWPHAVRNLTRSAELLSVLQAATHPEWDGILGAEPSAQLEMAHLRDWPLPRLGALLRHWYLQLRLAPPPFAAVRAIGQALRSPRRDHEPQVRWPGAQWRLWRARGYALPNPVRDWPPGWHCAWDGRQALALPDGGWVALSATTAPMPFEVSGHRAGMRMKLDPKRPSQSLKNLFQAAGIPPWVRRSCPWLWCDGMLWAVGDFFMSADCARWLEMQGAQWQWQRPQIDLDRPAG